MRPVLSRAQSRALDELLSSRFGLPSALLMENAGRGACDVLESEYPQSRRVLVVAGRGNNAGDGFVVARRLLTLGRAVKVVSLTRLTELGGDAALNAKAFVAVGGEVICDVAEDAASFAAALTHADLVVDAIVGTGLSRPLEGRFARVVERLTSSSVPVLALDLPSGLDADKGVTTGPVVRAEVTVTFGAHKPGLLTPRAKAFVGRIHVADLGAPLEESLALAKLVPHAQLLEASDLRKLWRGLAQPLHKGDAGRVVVVAGSAGTLGAARLVAHGAHRAGAGLVTIASFKDAIERIETETWETMTRVLEPHDGGQSVKRACEAADVVVLGPGLGLSEPAREVCQQVAIDCEHPVVIDADALTHFGGSVSQLRNARGPRLLTPHPKEAARLLGTTSEQVESDRFAAINELVRESNAAVLLKGAHTLLGASNPSVLVNDTGNSALSIGGSGDVLAGIIGGFSCRLPLFQAAQLGVWVHGRAAEHWVREHGGERGALAREIADQLPSVLGNIV
jgi:NAD(P)H-hydrate epimerase